MKVDTRIQYIADDGTAFNREQDCLDYEEDLRKRAENTTYWKIYYGFDCTEGRGFASGELIELPFKDLAHEYMLDFCFQRYGFPICYVQGVSAAPAWRLHQVDKAQFDAGMKVGFGDRHANARKVKLTVEPDGRNSHKYTDTVVE